MILYMYIIENRYTYSRPDISVVGRIQLKWDYLIVINADPF